MNPVIEVKNASQGRPRLTFPLHTATDPLKTKNSHTG